MSSEHDRAVDRVLWAGRLHSTAAVLYHSALAERSGLSVTESKALEVIERLGPITPGDLSRESGLAPASITGLLDRLTRKGVAHRVPHPADGRRFLVEVDPAYIAANQRLFDRFVASIRDLCAGYSAGELELIEGFLTEAARRQQEAATYLPAPAER
jgi:DNA-binding MarR family transcriptional regulator